MESPSFRTRRFWRIAIGMLLGLSGAFAQQTPPPVSPSTTKATATATPTAAEVEENKIIELDPFTVDADTDRGYMATETLAGTRLKTDVRDLAMPLQIVTEQFLENTGSKRNSDLLVYTTNTEVGGLYGNFSGVGNTQGVNENTNLIRPQQNTRVRGLDEADNTRNFFLTDIPWDSYIVDRVDINRGPNSILFGVGSPAGIINSSTMPASFVNSGNVEVVVDTIGSVRGSLNVNRALIEDLLAVRVAGLWDQLDYEQDPAYSDDNRVFGALTYQPELLGENNGRLMIRMSGEWGEIKANRPRIIPPTDQITPFWSGLNQQVYDPGWSWSNAQIDRGNAANAASRGAPQPWLGNEMDAITGGAPAMYYENGSSVPYRFQATGANTSFGIGPAGAIDKTIQSFPFGRLQDIAAFNEYSRNANALAPSMFPSAAKNFYKDKSLRDPGIFNFYDNLIDGSNKTEWTNWTSYNISLGQTFMDNRFGVEFVYDVQDLDRGQESIFGGATEIGVDINTYTNLIPTYYPAPEGGWPDGEFPPAGTAQPGDPNPMVGRAYVSGVSSNNSTDDNIGRTNYRGTAFVEFYGSDIASEDSALAKVIGRNTFTLLGAREEREFFNTQYSLFATDINWGVIQDIPIGINEYPRKVPFVVYLSDDLRNVNSAMNLNLDRIRSYINPTGTFDIEYFDSHWAAATDPTAPGYVDPAAPYVLPGSGADSTQSENWANYVGWTTMPVSILNARHGDQSRLTSSANRRNETLDSYGITWQGKLFDGTIIPTVGWRNDSITTWGSSGEITPGTNVVSTDFDNPSTPFNTIESEGDTLSWGIVAHSPQSWNDHIPWGLRFSGFYNSSENFKAENRVGFDTLPLPNPKGESQDYGVAVSTRDGRYTFKLTYFDTSVQDASIPGGSALGSNTWFLANVEAWGTASALTSELYWNGELPGLSWFSNYGLVDNNKWGDPEWEDVNSPIARNDPANQELFVAIQDWYATMQPQYFFDRYGLPINVAKAQGTLDDRRTMVDDGHWDPYGGIGSIQPAYGGLVAGLSPTGTINQQSTGYELEFSAQPIDNLNITLNATKTTAQRTDLGAQFSAFIEAQKERFEGPAGDIRMWWAGDVSIRKYYDDFIYQAYLFQLDANGEDAAEIRPYRFNFVANYAFTTGWTKGLTAGLGYRWQDTTILGYHLDDSNEKLDHDRPIKGASDDAIDLWASYTFNLTEKIQWRIQINVRNLFDSQALIPVSVNPDGAVATYRIVEGERWSLTNSFSF